MAKPEWKLAELFFEAHWKQFGKKAWVHRFTDAAQAIGMNGAKTIAPAQPSDYFVVHNGESFFAEVKYSSDSTGFHHSNIRPKQMACARMSVPAGGTYLFFIKSKVTGKWYCVPAFVITTHTSKTHHWADLAQYEWIPDAIS